MHTRSGYKTSTLLNSARLKGDRKAAISDVIACVARTMMVMRSLLPLLDLTVLLQ